MGVDTRSPEEFRRLLAARLRDDGWTVDEVEPLQVRVSRAGTNVTMNLDNLYPLYRDGAPLDAIADTVGQLLSTEGKAPAPGMPLDLERLMPLLKPAEFLREVERSQVESIAWRPFITADLVVTLVIDSKDSVRYVRAWEAEASGRSLDDLLETALGNLYGRSAGNAHELDAPAGGKIFVLATRDGYDATRILLKPLLERLAEQVKGDLVVGIPNRDFLIAFGDADTAMVASISQQVSRDAHARPYPLTGTLFTFRNGQLERYGPARRG